MSMDTIRFVLQYWKLKDYLVQELGYSKEEAARSITELRRMEPHILRLFLAWFRSDELPTESINGVHIQSIIEHNGLNPVAAFLAWNWVQTDPLDAKHALSSTHDRLEISDTVMEALRQVAAKHGWTIPEEEPEDTSDIVEPEQ